VQAYIKVKLQFTGPEDPRTVMVQSMSFVVEGREDYTFDLTGENSIAVSLN